MSVRALDKNHDWTFGKGLNDYLKESKEIKQNVKTRILQWKNDCFFALDEGVDWNTFLNKAESKLLTDDIRRVIVQTVGVADLIDFSASLENRVLNCSYTIVDTFSKKWKDEIETIGFNDA